MTQQSKLSEALAATLLRFKEIDRDTIEALCKRAATLEHQVAEVLNSNGTMTKSHNQLQWALRELLAQTRDLHDDGPEDDSYQSDALQNAIAVADALVGEKATEQYPIADEPLNRRIQELELKLAAAEKLKGQVFISEGFISSAGMTVQDSTGACRIRMGGLDVTESANIGVGSIAHIASEGRITKTDQPLMWSENALRKLMKDVLADRETELATSYNETQASMDELMGATFKQAQENLAKLPRDMDLKSVITVTGDEAIGALVKDIINTEMQPGGRIHKALIGNSPIPQPATPVCPPGMGLACAGLNTLVHVSPTVKGDEAMARKVRDIIFEEMKHGGVIHSAFYRK